MPWRWRGEEQKRDRRTGDRTKGGQGKGKESSSIGGWVRQRETRNHRQQRPKGRTLEDVDDAGVGRVGVVPLQQSGGHNLRSDQRDVEGLGGVKREDRVVVDIQARRLLRRLPRFRTRGGVR